MVRKRDASLSMSCRFEITWNKICKMKAGSNLLKIPHAMWAMCIIGISLAGNGFVGHVWQERPGLHQPPLQRPIASSSGRSFSGPQGVQGTSAGHNEWRLSSKYCKLYQVSLSVLSVCFKVWKRKRCPVPTSFRMQDLSSVLGWQPTILLCPCRKDSVPFMPPVPNRSSDDTWRSAIGDRRHSIIGPTFFSLGSCLAPVISKCSLNPKWN